ncbi:hypothetical protein TNCV_4140661 [Trichonephila clavipes]|nr:hypothetical protein TNCV_4140661 [Trichonephila clavipes]
MGDWSVHRRVLFQPEHRFSPYIHMETHYLQSNVREIDNYGGGGLIGLAWHHIRWPFTSPCLRKMLCD